MFQLCSNLNLLTLMGSPRALIIPVKMLALIALIMYVNSLFKNACVATSRARGLCFGLRLHLLSYFVYARSKGSDESVRIGCTGSSEPSPFAYAMRT